MYKYSHLFSIP